MSARTRTGQRLSDERSTNGRGWSVNLDIFRIVFLGCAVLPWALNNLAWIERILPGLPSTAWYPISFYRVLPIAVLTNVGLAKTLALVNLACIVLGLIGFFTRTSIGCATLLSLYLFGLAENQGKIDHFHHIIWFMALLAVGPSGRFLSIDAFRRAIRSADSGTVEPPRPHFEALWTLRYIWILMGLLYLVPGLAKLEKSFTSGWAGVPNLQNILWRKWFEMALYYPSPIHPLRVDHLPIWFLEMAGVGVIVIEIGFLFIVLFRRLRPLAALAGLGFSVGNGLILQIWFTTLILAYSALIDWCAIGRALSLRKLGPLVVFYDQQCRFCRRVVATLKSVDLFDVLDLKPVEAPPDGTDADLYDRAPYESRLRDIHAFAGNETLVGYEAYVAIAKRLPLLWPFAVIMQWSPVRMLGRRIYRNVADSRLCSLAPPLRSDREDRPVLRWVHVTGAGLVACQVFISFTMFIYCEMESFTAKLPRPFRSLVVHVGRSRPEWPFAHYPTFAAPTPREYEVWRACWVHDGREDYIGAPVYYKVFGGTGTTWNLLTNSNQYDEARSLDVVRALWRAESPGVRESVDEVRIYRAMYRLESPGPEGQQPFKATLLYSFPVELVSQGRLFEARNDLAR